MKNMELSTMIQILILSFLLLIQDVQGSTNATTSSSSTSASSDTTTKFLVSFIMIILMIVCSASVSYFCNRCLSRGPPWSKDDRSDISENTKNILRQRLEIIRWKRKQQKNTQKAFSRWSQKTKAHKMAVLDPQYNLAIQIEEVDSQNNSKSSLSFIPGLSNKVADADKHNLPDIKVDLATENETAKTGTDTPRSNISRNISTVGKRKLPEVETNVRENSTTKSIILDLKSQNSDTSPTFSKTSVTPRRSTSAVNRSPSPRPNFEHSLSSRYSDAGQSTMPEVGATINSRNMKFGMVRNDAFTRTDSVSLQPMKPGSNAALAKGTATSLTVAARSDPSGSSNSESLESPRAGSSTSPSPDSKRKTGPKYTKSPYAGILNKKSSEIKNQSNRAMSSPDIGNSEESIVKRKEKTVTFKDELDKDKSETDTANKTSSNKPSNLKKK